jgi:hypothetical protein
MSVLQNARVMPICIVTLGPGSGMPTVTAFMIRNTGLVMWGNFRFMLGHFLLLHCRQGDCGCMLRRRCWRYA